MSPSKRWVVALVTLLLAVIAAPAHAQVGPPLSFESPSPGSVVWPNAIEATVLNNTTEPLVVTMEITNFTEPQTGVTLPSNTLLEPYAPSLTLPPAGQATVTLPLAAQTPPAPGSYSGSLVFLVPDYNAVLRKPLTILVPLPAAEMAQAPTPPPLSAVVDTWTISAVRVLPFLRPVCLRGLALGCTMPVEVSGTLPDRPVTLGHLTNERGGGLTVTLKRVDERENARLAVAFDRAWGLTGAYGGRIDLPAADAAATESVDLTVTVKDIIIWPLLSLALGVMLARYVQRRVTVHRDVQELLSRLDNVSDQFDRLRKSIRGYSVAEDFQARRQALEEALLQWDRAHYGWPNPEEQTRFQTEIVAPLEGLEAQMDVWAGFQEKLERLRTVLELEATPAIEQAARPNDIDLDAPRFYTAAYDLLEGAPIALSQVPEHAARIEGATALAASWGELDQLASLVRQAVGDLNAVEAHLGDGEREMLDRARHDLNSAVRDLWEARDLRELQQRHTQVELESAQELTRRLMDPFVYYAGSETATEAEAPAPQAGGEQDAAPESHAAAGINFRSMARIYTHIADHRLPRLDYDRLAPSEAAINRTTVSAISHAARPLLFGERAVATGAVTIAVLAGLARYASTNFGSLADYLALFTWALAAKAGLEVANYTVSRLVLRDEA
ncbi:MAG: hypothetical protein ACP5HG_17930 [Anaerolineae bacterium]